ncbi:MAG: TonB-dependent receptor [Metallibacterium scheffleri]|uniref:TonB-dependent receptor plug domain-containing protein n=1 Tax=Metallibacterium scheffleri TaxID=993689 RepID=UPI0026F0D3B4|nr:TonB-dependent receptor [Metallibacterium scheffleri]MCK9366911.1 TonB-dependent receptor [Metallibacterium scheffleri]
MRFAPAPRHAVLFAALAAAGVTHAQDAKQQPTKAKELQTVVVTGTRMADRTVAYSMAPIDVLTPKDLEQTGAPSLAQALRTLLPSFNFPQPSVTDGTDAIQPAQLRGLSPDETLVLINGKRQHTTAIVNVNGTLGRGSSPVDLNAIPMNAIARIEVLRDGAAAQYGSDAIAGVINIILKGGNHGGSVSGTLGQYSKHDNADGRTAQGGADGGFALGQKGWIYLSADYTHQDPTNLAGPDLRYPTNPTYGQVTFHYGIPLLKQKNAAINMQYDLTPQMQFYAFSVFNKRDVSAGGFFRSLSAYSASNPAAVAVYPAGYLPIENSSILDTSLVAGLRGTVLDGWHYDLSYNTGGNHWKLDTSNTFNYSLGAASPTGFYIGTLLNREDVLNADFSKGVDLSWLKNPLTVAWGLEHRKDSFTIKQGDAASYAGAGAQVFPGYQPLDAGTHSRHDNAAYLDLETDFNDQLSGGFAVRHENYSDFGSTTSWKFSGRYGFNDTVALRATASTGFRAPSLQQEWYSSTAINFVNVGNTLVPFTIRTFPVNNPAAAALGAQPLQPEKSHNYSIGLVFTPQSGLYATVDLYQISIDNRIILSGNLVGTAVQNYLTSVGIPFVSGGRFFTNAVSTRTRGVDVVGTYPVQLGDSSTLKFTGGLNYNKTTILSIAPNPPQLGLAGLTLPVIDRTNQGYITNSTPRDKVFLAADWSLGNWRVHGQATRYGTWTIYGSTPSGDQTYGAKVLLDASVSYLWNNWDFTVGANNLTNQYPDQNNAANNFGGILAYPNSSPFGFSGAYYYGTATFRW